MEIEYANNAMKKTLEDPRLIVKKHGDIAKTLTYRMSDLHVAKNLSEITHLPPPRRHKLTGDFEGCWSVDVSKNKRLILRPIGDFEPEDLTSITTIRIENIVDYHER